METTDFEDILREAASEVTALDPDNLDAAEFRAIRRSAKRRLEIAWEYHFWPVLGRVEQRFFKPDWDIAAIYGVTDIVYYPPTQKYYQSLQDGNVALTPSASPSWTEAETSYSAAAYDDAAVYETGDRVEYGGDVYQNYGGESQGQPPTDVSYWTKLIPFDKYVPFEQAGKTALGIVAAAWSANPRVTTRGNELNWSLSENGVQIITPINYAWLEYRLRCPKISGENFDSTATYASGNQIYFSSTGTPGNFYTANASTAAGESPDTAPEKWDVLEIPRIFHKYLVHAVAADWLRGPGGGSADDVGWQMAIADGALEDQKTLLVGQQSQRIKTVVRTR